jgi:hypothetical protein
MVRDYVELLDCVQDFRPPMSTQDSSRSIYTNDFNCAQDSDRVILTDLSLPPKSKYTRHEDEILFLKSKLKEYESRDMQFEMLRTNYEKVCEENKIMKETIHKLTQNNNEHNPYSKNNSFDFAPFEKDKVLNEVLFHKMCEKIQDLEDELSYVKN